LKALLLVAHGSRRQQSNDEVTGLAEQLKKADSVKNGIVHTAFLDIAAPSIPEGIRKCIDDGAQSITLIPYFLNSGRHVINDIPEIVAETMKNYPHVAIQIAPHLGESGLMGDLLIKLVNSLSEGGQKQ